MSRSQRIAIAGMDFIPDLSGALFAPELRTLLVADLHLEKGTSLARRGVYIPPYDTRASLLQLQSVLSATKPERLVFLGDSFHDGDARQRIGEEDLAMLRSITSDVETLWITGNHDPSPPEDIGGRVISEVTMGAITLRHQPKALSPSDFEIAGHLHPAAAIHARGHRIRCRCFIASHNRIIMPAFGSYTGALSVTSQAFDGLFDDYNVWMIGTKAIHRFPASQVR